jgi:hypothetical protein
MISSLLCDSSGIRKLSGQLDFLNRLVLIPARRFTTAKLVKLGSSDFATSQALDPSFRWDDER